MSVYPMQDGFFLIPDSMRFTPDTPSRIYRGGPAFLVFPPHTLAMSFPKVDLRKRSFMALRRVGTDLMMKPARSLDLMKPSERSQYDVHRMHRLEDGGAMVLLDESDMKTLEILMTDTYHPLMETPEGRPFMPTRCWLDADQVNTEHPYVAVVGMPRVGWETVEVNGRDVRVDSQEITYVSLQRA